MKLESQLGIASVLSSDRKLSEILQVYVVHNMGTLGDELHELELSGAPRVLDGPDLEVIEPDAHHRVLAREQPPHLPQLRTSNGGDRRLWLLLALGPALLAVAYGRRDGGKPSTVAEERALTPG